MNEEKVKFSGLWDERRINEMTSSKGVWKYGSRIRLHREFIR